MGGRVDVSLNDGETTLPDTRIRGRVWARLLAALLGALIANASIADVVTLKDGRVIEGIIVLDSPSKVVIETMVGQFKTKLEFRKHEVASAVRKELPEGFFNPGGAAKNKEKKESPAREKRDRSDRTVRYVEIPIEGKIGVEAQAEGVERALDTAINRGVQHAIFVIDSPGGYVADAEAIASAIEDRRGKIRCWAVVESAISAAIWVTISCDRVFIRRDGQIGGAVVYSQDRTTGAAEVDAKMNSIIAAKLAAKAERAGLHGEAVRAMIVPEAEYYAWSDEQGRVQHGVSKPSDLPAERVIVADNDRSVLTLTGTQALDAGIATEHAGHLDELGDLVGEPGWKDAGNIGISAMAAAQRSYERQREKQGRLIDDIKTAFEELKALQDEAVGAHPNNFTYTYDIATNLLVPASQMAWRHNTDNALRLWRRLLSQTERIERMQQRAESLGLERAASYEELKKYHDACQEALFDLERNRNRRYVNR